MKWLGRTAERLAGAGCVVFLASLAACRSGGSPEVVVYTSVDQVFSEPVFAAAQERAHLNVKAVFDTEETKSTGVTNRLIAEGGRPLADVFWSGDPVRPFLLIKRGLLEAYRSPVASGIPAGFRAPDGTWTGLAARARVLLVNTQKVPEGERPRSIRDLVSPRWRGQVAVANPLFGTTTMHVAALFAAWGDEKGQAFLQDLKVNAVRIASSNGEVKRLVVSGEVAFGVTDTDDALDAVKERAPVSIVYPDQDSFGTLVMPTTVVLVKGAPHPEAGRRFIDYLLSGEAETRMAASGGHMPLRPDVTAPEDVRKLAQIKPMDVDYQQLGLVMERIEPLLRRWSGM